MPTWPLLVAAAIAVAAILIILPIRDAAKVRRRISATFGKLPAQPRGLDDAFRFYRSFAARYPDDNAVDALTWNDLDMDNIFRRVNACQSAAGDARLYTVLRRPHTAAAEAQAAQAARQKLMDLFLTDVALREKVQYRLARLGRADGSSLEMCAFHPKAMTLHRRWLFILLGMLPLFCIALLFFNTTLGIIGLGGSLILNFNLSSIIKNRNDSGFRSVRFFAAARSCALHLIPLLQKAAPEEAAALRKATANFKGSRLSILLLNYNDLMEGTLGFDFTAIFLLPLLAYGSLAVKLTNSGEATQALFRNIGDIDVAASVLSTQLSLPYFCKPAFTEETRLDCKDLYHPLIDDPVPNNAVFTKGMLVTGSNASGKSTFIKSVALNCLFAQSIGLCTANGFTLRSGAVATSMAVEDSVVDGDSYFVAEIKSMRRLMRRAAGDLFCWFFIDEILKGTNTVERVAASSAVLRQLAGTPSRELAFGFAADSGETNDTRRWQGELRSNEAAPLRAAGANCIAFAATHDVELTAILGGLYGNCHFRETVREAPADGEAPATGSVFFDYKLRDGPATTRNAILLLERMDFPAAVTADARALVARFERTGEWGTLADASSGR